MSIRIKSPNPDAVWDRWKQKNSKKENLEKHYKIKGTIFNLESITAAEYVKDVAKGVVFYFEKSQNVGPSDKKPKIETKSVPKVEKVTFYEFTNKVNKEDWKNIVDSIITPDMSDFYKVKIINKYLVYRYEYDYTLISNNVYSALTTGKTICQGYAMSAYKMLSLSKTREIVEKCIPETLRPLLRNGIRKVIGTEECVNQLMPSEREYLEEYFRPSIEKLQEMTGFDLTIWKTENH